MAGSQYQNLKRQRAEAYRLLTLRVPTPARRVEVSRGYEFRLACGRSQLHTGDDPPPTTKVAAISQIPRVPDYMPWPVRSCSMSRPANDSTAGATASPTPTWPNVRFSPSVDTRTSTKRLPSRT